MNAPAYHPLCLLSSLTFPAARGFSFTHKQITRHIFVVRQGENAYAYENQCPHTGAPLDWQPDAFLDRTGEQIICAMHGARFRIEDGYCLAGPCTGASLQALSLCVTNGELRLLLDTP